MMRNPDQVFSNGLLSWVVSSELEALAKVPNKAKLHGIWVFNNILHFTFLLITGIFPHYLEFMLILA